MEQIDKNSIRSAISKHRSSLENRDILSLSAIIEKAIISSGAFQRSSVIMAYMPIRNEVMTDMIIEAALKSGKAVCLPRVADKNHIESAPLMKLNEGLKSSVLNIWEPVESIAPVDPAIIDLVIVPGIAFDRNGHRIGFGKGYYDRFIPNLKKSCIKIAPAYQFQVLSSIPYGESDQNIDAIVTENEWIACV